MISVLISLLLTARSSLRSRAALQLGVLALTSPASGPDSVAIAVRPALADGPAAVDVAISRLARLARGSHSGPTTPLLPGIVAASECSGHGRVADTFADRPSQQTFAR
jgi:hypothetical protein